MLRDQRFVSTILPVGDGLLVAHYRAWHRQGRRFLVRADDDRLVRLEYAEPAGATDPDAVPGA